MVRDVLHSFLFSFFFLSLFLPFTVETKVARRRSFVQGIRIREATVLERNEYLILMTLTRKNEGGKGNEGGMEGNEEQQKSNEIAPIDIIILISI